MGPLLLHPGFHKTGTSSLQRGAIALQDRLNPHLTMMFAPDLGNATRLARRYAEHGEPETLCRFHEAFHAAVATLDPDDPRPVLISAEDLSGCLPDTNGVTGYDALPPLAREAARALKDTFGRRRSLRLLLTTRAPEAWLRSAYWQVLRATRLTEEFDDFARRMQTAADFEPVIAAVRAALGDAMTVDMLALEDCAHAPLGPLGHALGILGIPSDGLPALPAQNVQPDKAADAFLRLNRSDLSNEDLSAAKRRLLQEYRATGATRRAARRAPAAAKGP